MSSMSEEKAQGFPVNLRHSASLDPLTHKDIAVLS